MHLSALVLLLALDVRHVAVVKSRDGVAEALAANLMKIDGTEARVNTAYKKLFQRVPRKTEMGIANQFFEGHENDPTVWTQYTHALLAGNEFQFIE